MKFASVVLISIAALVAAKDSDSHTNLRTASAVSFQQSACNDIKDEKHCFATKDEGTGKSCVWCDCQAVPSVCVTPDQAEGLPPGVFDCKSPDKTFFDFHLEDGRTHQLKETITEAGAENICDASSKSISGYMDVKGSKYDESGDKHLFFWMFEKRNSHLLDEEEASEIPFVVWLTGGPGCSSTLALLTENGPCSVNPDGKTTKINPYSWTEAAHVLWLDQPAGVGYSYGDENDSGEAMVSEDAYYFFQAFFQAHPEYSKSPLYIIGESYAGHYVPAITHRIWKGNQSPCEKCIDINLAGLAIGNGLTNPEEQYQWYPEMVWNNSHGIKVVDESVYQAMKAAVPKCVALIHQCNQGDNTIDNFACQTAFLVCNLALTSPYQATGLNPYDIRKKCDKPPLCYDFSNVANFLNLESTKQALGVDESHVHNWNACNYGINMKFHTDWMKDFSPYVADLLDAGFPALIYAGDVDFICNYLGNQAWTKGLAWKHSADFNAAEVHDWNGGAGLARSSNGFTFLQVKDGGHMVPSDQPEVSLTMLKTFLSGGEF
ncbi:peptidase S10 serine carboxypeptidase family protein [Nitzschia inconspicua]|uniref:Carboxypeptidase n=1 Tax=Nitzschia inconspicua TaxID=303405 RepID=A0A9K3LZ39_9STRA|nr:peptidase S10 serine carboxypeptidase family protein [Nitzschia inconspicua]